MQGKNIAAFFILVATDICALFASFYFAYLIRAAVIQNILNLPETFPFNTYIAYPYVVIIWPLVLFNKGLYNKRYMFWEEIMNLLKGSTFAFLLVIILVFALKISTNVSRIVMILAWIISLFLLPIFRLGIKGFLLNVGVWKRGVLILGAATTGKLILDGLRREKLLGYEVRGFLDDDKEKIGREVEGVRILGRVNEVDKWAKKTGSADIVIAMPSISRVRLLQIVEICEEVALSIRIVPDTIGLSTTGVDVEDVKGALLLNIRRNLNIPWNKAIKSIFDIAICIIALLVISPLIIIISLAIKIDSRGPIFYVEERLGKDKKNFKCYKFRSMFINGSEILKKFLKENPSAKEEWKKFRKLRSYDPRITRVGKFIRKYSLDELPQLLNVLKGEMSLVGPRPYLPQEIKLIGKYVDIVLKVKPGITGMWQVGGRSELSFRDRLRLDEYYVRNWSLEKDFVLIIKTIKILFLREGAY